MSFRLQARQYKSLRHLDWSPSGVAALVGPNGGGKTTALWTPEVLRLALESNLTHALTVVGGSGPVRCFDAPDREPTEVSIAVDGLLWTVRPEQRTTRVWERVTADGVPLVERDSDGDSIRVPSGTLLAGDLLALARAANADDQIVQQIAPLVQAIRGYRVHGDYELRVLREIGSQQSQDLKMNSSGTNVFAVLQRWRELSDHEYRWTFVIERLREAFPGFFRTFDFEPAGNVISLVVRAPGRPALRPNDWPNGFFALLLNLCGVAGSDASGIVAFDEPETALHPSLIRFCLEAFREWSVEHGVTVLLATHSPVVLDGFAAQPDQVYVMEAGHERLPVRLDELKQRDWLRHFSLGDLYEHEKFGAQRCKVSG
jgi:predicted ATPase